jgi:hypothetical protein
MRGLTRNTLRKIAYFCGIKKHETTDSFRVLIAPEITNGTFFELIQAISSRKDVVNIVEIGSSSGEGSTRALVESLSKVLDDSKSVHCLEVSKERFEKLSTYLKIDSRFIAHRVSSVKISDFPEFARIENFYKETNSELNKYHLDTIKSWYKKDIEYLQNNPELVPKNSINIPVGGIQWIKEKYNIKEFDFVIIDGGEFTGFRELEYVMGANFIALDDVNSYKCYQAFKALEADSLYHCVDSDLKDRNGWAIFQKQINKNSFGVSPSNGVN